MKIQNILLIATSTIALTISSAFAESHASPTPVDAAHMDKCEVVDKAGTKHVVMVPKGECDKVKSGDYSGVPETVKHQVEEILK